MDQSEKMLGRVGMVMAAVVGAAFMIPITMFGSPQPAISLANGTYYNPCCGKIILKNGLLMIEGGQARYTLSPIKAELILSVDADVGVEDGSSLRLLPKRGINWVKPWVYPQKSNMLNVGKRSPNRLSLLGIGADQSWYTFDRE
jgi:hypothetical protein